VKTLFHAAAAATSGGTGNVEPNAQSPPAERGCAACVLHAVGSFPPPRGGLGRLAGVWAIRQGMALPVAGRPTAAILPGSVLLESATRQACQPGLWVSFNMKSVARSAAKASARLASSSTVAFEFARWSDAFARRATLELATCLDGVLVHHSSDATVSPRSIGADADPSAAAARRLSMMESPDAAKPSSVSAAALHGASPRHLCVHAQACCCVALRRGVWRLTGVPASCAFRPRQCSSIRALAATMELSSRPKFAAWPIPTGWRLVQLCQRVASAPCMTTTSMMLSAATCSAGFRHRLTCSRSSPSW